MVGIDPVAGNLSDIAHQPAQNVELMWRLIYEYTPAFGRPLAPPRIRPVVSVITPTQHRHHSENGSADLANLNGRLHALDWLEETPLAHNSQFDVVPPGSINHHIAIAQVGR